MRMITILAPARRLAFHPAPHVLEPGRERGRCASRIRSSEPAWRMSLFSEHCRGTLCRLSVSGASTLAIRFAAASAVALSEYALPALRNTGFKCRGTSRAEPVPAVLSGLFKASSSDGGSFSMTMMVNLAHRW
jgi:hypothetical protein